MLYFDYGSNLNHYQMKNIRCFGSKYLKNHFLKDYKLIFCHPNELNKFGYANVIKKKGLGYWHYYASIFIILSLP